VIGVGVIYLFLVVVGFVYKARRKVT